MTVSEPDDEKNRVRSDWAGRGAHWNRRADELAEPSDRMNQPLLEAAAIESGQSVLDLASCAGEPALTIARRVGPSGRVCATDMVPEMLAGAKRRAAEAALTNIRFEIADMEALPLPDASFDVVTCRFGLMFVPEPSKALAEALRVLRPGGRAAFMVWGPRDDTTLFRVFTAAGETVFGDDPGIDFERPFRFGEDGRLSALLSAAGFVGVEERAFRIAPRLPAGSRFWEPQRDMSFGPLLAGADASVEEALDGAIQAGLEAYRDGDELHLTVHARIGIGNKPD